MPQRTTNVILPPLSYIRDKSQDNTCKQYNSKDQIIFPSYQKLMLTTYLVFIQAHSSAPSLILLLKNLKTVKYSDQHVA